MHCALVLIFIVLQTFADLIPSSANARIVCVKVVKNDLRRIAKSNTPHFISSTLHQIFKEEGVLFGQFDFHEPTSELEKQVNFVQTQTQNVKNKKNSNCFKDIAEVSANWMVPYLYTAMADAVVDDLPYIIGLTDCSGKLTSYITKKAQLLVEGILRGEVKNGKIDTSSTSESLLAIFCGKQDWISVINSRILRVIQTKLIEIFQDIKDPLSGTPRSIPDFLKIEFHRAGVYKWSRNTDVVGKHHIFIRRKHQLESVRTDLQDVMRKAHAEGYVSDASKVKLTRYLLPYVSELVEENIKSIVRGGQCTKNLLHLVFEEAHNALKTVVLDEIRHSPKGTTFINRMIRYLTVRSSAKKAEGCLLSIAVAIILSMTLTSNL